MASQTIETEREEPNKEQSGRIRGVFRQATKSVIIISPIMALLTGILCAWAFLGFGGVVGLVAFFIGGALTWRHLMHRNNGWLAIGRGMHISAVVMFFLPVLFYIPSLLSSSTKEGAKAAGTFVGSFLGIIIWGIVFGFVALLFGVIGYVLNRKGSAN